MGHGLVPFINHMSKVTEALIASMFALRVSVLRFDS